MTGKQQTIMPETASVVNQNKERRENGGKAHQDFFDKGDTGNSAFCRAGSAVSEGFNSELDSERLASTWFGALVAQKLAEAAGQNQAVSLGMVSGEMHGGAVRCSAADVTGWIEFAVV